MLIQSNRRRPRISAVVDAYMLPLEDLEQLGRQWGGLEAVWRGEGPVPHHRRRQALR